MGKSNDKERKKNAIFTCCFWIFVVSSLWFFAKPIPFVYAGTDDDILGDILDICLTPPPELVDICMDLLSGGMGAPPAVNILNTGTLGAQGRTANITARQRKKSIEERLEELKKKEDKKGKTSTDGGERIKTFFGKFGFFISGKYTDTDRDQTTVETGYDAELKGGMLGIDYRFNDKFVAGIAGGYNTQDADFNRDTGHLDTDSSNITLYGNITPLKNLYVDGYMGFTNIDYRTKRATTIGKFTPVIETATGHTDARQYTAGFNTGYNWHYGSLAIGPQAKLDYINTHINNYTETGSVLAQKYKDQTIQSLTTNVGFQTSYAQSFSWGVLVPQARLYWVHQYKNESRDITSSLDNAPTVNTSVKTEKPDRNYMVFGGGMSTVLPHGVQLFADYETTFSHEFLHIWTATVGFRMEF